MFRSLARQSTLAFSGAKVVLVGLIAMTFAVSVQGEPAIPSLQRFETLYAPADLRQARLTWPVVGPYRISSNYGHRQHPISGSTRFHRGVDIAVPLGTPILSVAAGEVVFAGWKRGYGWVIDIAHGQGWQSRYAHAHAIGVKKGQHIVAGQVIGQVGRSGQATGAHLHLEIAREGEPMDPLTLWRKL